jgi:hypothetical protein
MSIQERINPDNLNIHQFQEMPEGRAGLPFDVDRDVSAVQKENIKKIIVRSSGEISAGPAIYLLPARNYKFLWPNEPIPGTPLSPEILESLKLLLSSSSSDQIGSNHYLACLKILYPELQIEGDASKLKKLESVEASEAEIYDFLENAANLKILNPDFSISYEELELAKNILEKIKSDDLINFLEFAPNLRIIDPSYRPTLTDGEWKQLKERLSNMNDPDFEESADAAERMKILAAWEHFLLCACDMKILAADKVEVTRPGVIEFQTYPQDINTSTPTMPEGRKF